MPKSKCEIFSNVQTMWFTRDNEMKSSLVYRFAFNWFQALTRIHSLYRRGRGSTMAATMLMMDDIPNSIGKRSGINHFVQQHSSIISLTVPIWDIHTQVKSENSHSLKEENKMITSCTEFENHRKSLIQHCEWSELRLHFEWTKVNQKCLKWSILASFWKPEAYGQTGQF